MNIPIMEKKKTNSTIKMLLQFFLQGIIVIAPFGITVYIVLYLFSAIDNILPNIISFIFPRLLTDAEGHAIVMPGLGFLFVIVFVVLVGWLSSLFFVERLVSILDHALERTPGIRLIYSSIKDFLEAFAGNKKKFDKPVLVNVDAAAVWRVGFITQKDASSFDLAEHVVVYVPHSYAISGITYIVPRENIRPIKATAAEAMKFVVSGGVTEVD